MLACGVFGTSAITALTAQNTQGVHNVHIPSLEFLAQQIDAVLGDIGAQAVKTGMLPNVDVVELVASKVRVCMCVHVWVWAWVCLCVNDVLVWMCVECLVIGWFGSVHKTELVVYPVVRKVGLCVCAPLIVDVNMFVCLRACL